MDSSVCLPGFVPGDPELFRHDASVDLRDPGWCFCEFRFRGLHREIGKLREYLNNHGLQTHTALEVSDAVGEVRVAADEKTPELIGKFPALRATGLAEHWQRQMVYVLYSESGFAGITRMQAAGYFDRHHDAGDGRWEWEYDMMEPVRVRFTWLQTGEEVRVSYRYPYADEWNRTAYTAELSGRIYVPAGKPEDDFVIEDGVLKDYRGFGGDVVIPASVHQIDAYCQVFHDNSAITSVTVPGSVLWVPGHTFFGARNLRRVILEEGVTAVGRLAFGNCASLTELVLPQSLTRLEPYAFNRCPALDVAKLKLPAGLRCAGQAFRLCQNIPLLLLNEDRTILLSASVTDRLAVPETVEEIGDFALYEAESLTSVRFPAGLRRIGIRAFENCAGLKPGPLPESLESIGENAFRGCGGMDELILPDSVKTVDRQALGMPVRKVRLSPGMKRIPGFLFVSHAYAGYENDPRYSKDWKIPLEEAEVSEGTEAIDACGFVGCAKLRMIRLPESLKSIGARAFAHCGSLPRVQLPSGLTAVEDETFRDCAALREIRLPLSVKRIGGRAFRGCASLERVVIGNAVEEIGEGAFLKCAALEEVTLPRSLVRLKKEAFRDCARLKAVEIPASVTKIGAKVFAGCPNVTIRCEKGSKAEEYARKNGLKVSVY